MNKIKIISGTFFPTVGGAEVLVANQALALCKQHALELVIPTRGRKYLNKINALNCVKTRGFYSNRLIAYFLLSPGLGLILAKIYAYFLDIKVDDIKLYHDCNFMGLIGLLLNDKNSSITFHGSDILHRPDLSYGRRQDPRYERVLKQKLANYSGFFFTLNDVFSDILINEFKVSPSRVVRVNNFAMRGGRNSRVTVVADEFSQPLRLLTIGRNHPKKRINLIPDILRSINLDIKIEWIVVGRGYDYGTISIGDHLVRYACPVSPINGETGAFPNPDLYEYYEQCDAYIHLATDEGQPIVLYEALANGAPVIAMAEAYLSEFEWVESFEQSSGYSKLSALLQSEILVKIKENQQRCAKEIIDGGEFIKCLEKQFKLQSVHAQGRDS